MTCNSVMRVLRQNKDSLMAVLEAFVYDPLLNWRLIDSKHNLFTCAIRDCLKLHCICLSKSIYTLKKLNQDAITTLLMKFKTSKTVKYGCL